MTAIKRELRRRIVQVGLDPTSRVTRGHLRSVDRQSGLHIQFEAAVRLRGECVDSFRLCPTHDQAQSCCKYLELRGILGIAAIRCLPITGKTDTRPRCAPTPRPASSAGASVSAGRSLFCTSSPKAPVPASAKSTGSGEV